MSKSASLNLVALRARIEEPGRFLTFETWTDQAALHAHMKTPAIRAAGAQSSGPSWRSG